MANGKIMDPNHVIGAKAIQFIKGNILPPEWVVREMYPDYGIDLDVELFDFENQSCVTLGEHLFLQVKGTEHPKYGMFTMGKEKVNVIKYQLEVSELNLVERMGSAFPVLLILVDLENKVAFHLCLNDYIRKILPIQNPTYQNQKTIVINIPFKNTISCNNLDVLRWYGKRTKIYSMFHEMLVDIEDFDYLDNDELIKQGKLFIEHYRQYDVLNSKKTWFGLNHIKSTLDNLYENDCLCEKSIQLVQRTLGYTENWEKGMIFEGDFCDDEGINAYVYAQKLSIQWLERMISCHSGEFETYCRDWFMPGLLLGV